MWIWRANSKMKQQKKNNQQRANTHIDEQNDEQKPEIS